MQQTPEHSLTPPIKPDRFKETALFVFLLGVLLILRVLNAYNFRFDSDEPQHLHVVWGWSNGLLQYRDLFDNHAPLFHILCAPLLSRLGERPDILIPMRLAMLPFFFGALWLIYRIGSQLWSKRVGAWGALFAGFCPIFFHTATEFRTDDLWMFLWFATLSAFVGGKPTLPRMAAFGFLLGATFAASMKTSLLLFTFCGAGAVVLGFKWAWESRVSWSFLLGRAGVAVLFALIVPGILVAYFGAQHALDSMYYCIIGHNVVPGLKRWKFLGIHTAVFAVLVPCLILVAVAVFRSGSLARRGGQALLLLASGLYIITLYCFWPDITREDFLPFAPLAVLVSTPLCLALIQKAQEKLPALRPTFLLCLLALVEIAGICKMHKPWHNYNSGDITEIAKMLQLSRPGEYVMDAKSGAIYRPRPFFYVLETITRARMKMGLLEDTIPEDLVATGTRVVQLAGIYSKGRAYEFIRDNYLPLMRGDDVRVPGKMFPAETGPGRHEFDIAIAGRYQIIDPSGTITASVDGRPVESSVFLKAGRHVIEIAQGNGPFCLFWKKAATKGFSPFHNPPAENT